MIRVIIADDQVLLRDSIGYILDNDNEIEIIGSVGSGVEAIKLCETLNPDVVLMDIEMPELDGVKATSVIKQRFSHIKVVMLTTFENDDSIMEAFIVGADGYIIKNIGYEDLVLTIKCVYKDLTVIHECVKTIMIKRFKGLSDYKIKYQDLIDEKELEIIKLIANGKSNKEIGTILNYSEGTIKNKITKLLHKLEMSDRMQIALFAMENGMV